MTAPRASFDSCLAESSQTQQWIPRRPEKIQMMYWKPKSSVDGDTRQGEGRGP